MKTRYVLSCLLLGSALSVSAQKTAVKSNLLSAANGALNAGVEYAFGPKSTFDLSGSIRPWKRTEGYVNKYWLILNPEKPDVPLNKNDAFQKVQKRRVQEKR